jgi:hypothetical protein
MSLNPPQVFKKILDKFSFVGQDVSSHEWYFDNFGGPIPENRRNYPWEANQKLALPLLLSKSSKP